MDMSEFVSHPLLKPDTVSSRTYQLTLAEKALKQSSLIVLPTGLGKTIIALFVILDRLKDGKKVLMLSPTKPLVEQHAAFLRRVMAIDPEKVAVFTGSVAPAEREEEWKNAQIVVSTPQVIENDVLLKRFGLADVSAIVFDEAHRATGDYAYVYIAKKYFEQCPDPLVLGITASPGSTPEKINEVKESLHIGHVELKTESDADVAPYIYEKDVEWVRVEVPDKAAEIKILLDSLLDDRLDKLKAIGIDARLNKKELLMLQAKLHASINRGGSPESYKAVSILAEIMKIEHAVDLIQTQGVVPLKKYFDRLREEASSKGGSKATKRLMQDARLAGAIRVADTADEVNPKTEKVREIVLEQLKEKPSSRIIVFTNFRDTAEFVSRELATLEGVKPVRFVGQASKLNDKGLTQKKQVEILDAFRAGDFNTLIATSVAEEGLDIPSTDLVIFYEPVPSEIRSIQRRGRTGRNAVGRVVVLISKGTRDEGTYRVSQAKEKKMYRTMNDMKDGQRMTDILEGRPDSGAPVAQIRDTTPYLPQQGQMSLKEFGARTETKPPEVIEIYADMREMRSAVLKHLEDMKAVINVRTLEVGDYVLSDRVCVERKTTDDFLDTLFGADRSLFEQIIAMKHAYMRPLLIIEGEGLYTKRRITPNVIRGVLASIAVDYGVPILFTADEAETASFLFAIARREQAERKRSVNPHAQKSSHTLSERQEYLVSAISEVGPVIAKNLLAHFGSVKAIVNATEEELMRVDRVGERTAKKIREVMDSLYRPNGG
jgi:ERCC4-related helicase/ERCC4-type nuclease